MNELLDWLDRGQHWLGRLQAAGLTCASPTLLDEGRHWQQQAELLGWPEAARHAGCITDTDSPLAERARAVLDLAVWVATGRRVVGL